MWTPSEVDVQDALSLDPRPLSFRPASQSLLHIRTRQHQQWGCSDVVGEVGRVLPGEAGVLGLAPVVDQVGHDERCPGGGRTGCQSTGQMVAGTDDLTGWSLKIGCCMRNQYA